MDLANANFETGEKPALCKRELLPWSEDTVKRDRTRLLNPLDADYPNAFKYLVNEWIENSLEPSELEKAMIRTVNDIEQGKPISLLDGGERTVYDKLVEYGVPKLLDVATTHRQWIKLTFNFLKIVGVKFPDEMDTIVRIHDLTKYTRDEALGYAVMFGQTGEIKELEGEELTEWKATLKHHYDSNPHHPEFFDNRRDDDPKMSVFDGFNPYLAESIIDMLAARGERRLKGDAKFSVSKWFDMPDQYLNRYSSSESLYNRKGSMSDRESARNMLKEWAELSAKYQRNTETLFLDNRPLVE